MGAFYRAEVDVLVATTVVEVGVDVPNATVMVIEHAERFGLSQLHQLRGRVGRGAGASTCLLVTHGRLSDEARARVDVLTRSDDGFVIAEKDLELRGPGDFFGTRQSGLPHLRVGDLLRDRDLLILAREEAFRYVEQSRATGAGGPLAELLERGGWQRRFGLARVG
jgi:ATP-dependent DNA helicase RecG